MDAIRDARSGQARRLSILDRLLAADEPDDRRDALSRAAALRASVQRDLKALFNSRICQASAPTELAELRRSLLTYGLSDLQTRPLASDPQREVFRRQFEAVIRHFEPRLRQVVVEMAPADPLDRTLRFRIRGLLAGEENLEPIVYDAAVDPASRNLAFTGMEARGA